MADCYFCGREVDPLRETWHRIDGWERKAQVASRKSGSDIALRKALERFAHPSCVRKEQLGLGSGQEALL